MKEDLLTYSSPNCISKLVRLFAEDGNRPGKTTWAWKASSKPGQLLATPFSNHVRSCFPRCYSAFCCPVPFPTLFNPPATPLHSAPEPSLHSPLHPRVHFSVLSTFHTQLSSPLLPPSLHFTFHSPLHSSLHSLPHSLLNFSLSFPVDFPPHSPLNSLSPHYNVISTLHTPLSTHFPLLFTPSIPLHSILFRNGGPDLACPCKGSESQESH